MAALKKSETPKKNTHVGVLFQKRYFVTLLKWVSTADIFLGISNFIRIRCFKNTSQQLTGKCLYFFSKSKKDYSFGKAM